MKKAELRNIHKIFETPPDASGGVQRFTALDGVTLSFLPGEIHTILGENGAGKSTLVHIFSGLHKPTGGTISIGSRDLFFDSPSDALSAGIAMVHQRPLLCGEITVLENILLGSRSLFLRRTANAKKIETLEREWNISLDLSSPAHTLNPAGRLYTALLGALFRNPDFLVLDEPAAILVPDERERFFNTLREKRKNGLAVVMITHKIEEALRWSDRISILRHGKLVFSAPVAGNEEPLTREFLENLLNPAQDGAKMSNCLVTGGNPDSGKNPDSGQGLILSAITARPENRNPVHNISFAALPGKITGIFGLPGSGIETLEDILSGMITADSGALVIEGKSLDVSEINPPMLRAAGIAFVPSDRAFRGSHPDLSIFDMLTPYRDGSFLLPQAENAAFVRSLLEGEGIDARPERTAKTLSGGQLQRLILARELAANPRILILAEPEWGLDIRSAGLLRERLARTASEGTTVIILTDNLDSIADCDFYSETMLLMEGVLA